MAINLSRNTRLWISTVNTGHNSSNTFEIPVQEGYSLTQSVGTADISAEEAGPVPTRGGKRFNTQLDPVEWSFSTYFNPYSITDDSSETFKLTVDMLLWHSLASSSTTDTEFTDGAWDGVTAAGTSKVYGDSTKFKVDFSNNNAHVLTELFMYFQIDNDVFLVEQAQVGQAEISIDISDIAQVAWSGNATKYTRLSAEPAFIAGGGVAYNESAPIADRYAAIPANKVYLINKLTTMSFQSDVSGTNLFYSVPITAGTVTINNNVTYLTPNTLSEVDVPIGSFTGAFEVTGTLSAYLRYSANAGTTAGEPKGTTNLLEDMQANPGKVTNTTNVVMYIGGQATGTPLVKITMPTTHVAVPTLSTDDIVSTEIEFKAIPTSADLISGDEITIEMTDAQA